MSAILYYISGHGYGHAVRSAQVVRALLKARRGIAVHVRTTAPQWLFPRSARYSSQSLDVGLVQRDSLQMDLAATLQACKELYGNADQVIDREFAFLRENNIDLIVADIPPLAFAIAARAGVQSVAITNFSWDGIYSSYADKIPEFAAVVERISSYQNCATLLLKLPYACPMETFPVQHQIPWIARRSRIGKLAAREKFALPRDAKIVLLSFGGLGLDRLPWSKLKLQKDLFFVATGDASHKDGNTLILPDTQRHYEDLLSAIDILVTKPGYGIVADVLSQRVPILYTDRGEFTEYEYLVRALQDCATADYIPQPELLTGNVAEYTTRILNKTPNWPEVRLDGASVAANEILTLLDRSR